MTVAVIAVRMCWNAMGVRRDVVVVASAPRVPRAFAQPSPHASNNVFCVVHQPDGETCIGKHLKGSLRRVVEPSQ